MKRRRLVRIEKRRHLGQTQDPEFNWVRTVCGDGMEDWRGLADRGAFEELAEALIELHYDPAYDRSSRKDPRPRLGVVELERLDDERQGLAAREIARLVDTASTIRPPKR